ncbi:MAG: OmpA family protein [Rhodoferax sp.]|nr:OmpA family protein [Rhodoferax sp.]
MKRRQWITAAAAALLSAAGPVAMADEAVVPAAKIIDALRSKDIVIDRPGQPAQQDPAIDLQVQFTFGSATLTPVGKRQLDELAMALGDRALANASFLLAGHTDAVGGLDVNMRLSLQRAEAVKGYLVTAHRLAPVRLQTLGYGPTRLADPANPQAALNRRVEVRRLRPGVATGQAPAAAAARLVPTPGR